MENQMEKKMENERKWKLSYCIGLCRGNRGITEKKMKTTKVCYIGKGFRVYIGVYGFRGSGFRVLGFRV